MHFWGYAEKSSWHSQQNLSQLLESFYHFRKKPRKNGLHQKVESVFSLSHNGLVFRAIALAYAPSQKRCRNAARCARVAPLVGFRVPSL